MSITMSPVDDIGGLASGGSGGGGTGVGRPWWDFPAPPGPPKPGSIPGACWHQQVAKTGEHGQALTPAQAAVMGAKLQPDAQRLAVIPILVQQRNRALGQDQTNILL